MRFVGTRRSVLWEGDGQELEDSEAYLWSGLTDNYLRVMAEAPSPDALTNVVTCARLDALHGDSFAGTVEM
jgi:hypothetical protein